jgi:adenylate kinase
MGPPGAGKGTQGELLAHRFGIPRYATGDILRVARREGSKLGREAQSYMDAGELVPDDVILGLIGEALDSPEAQDGCLFDGFPRTVAQALGLDALLHDDGRDLDAVVNLAVSDAEIVRRLSSRQVCGDCGRVAPAGDGRTECPGCGGGLVMRRDDRPETVLRRLEVYRGQTEPVLTWYRDSTTPVLDIPGTGDIVCVQERILAALAA